MNTFNIYKINHGIVYDNKINMTSINNISLDKYLEDDLKDDKHTKKIKLITQKEFENKRRELLKQDNPKWEDKKQLEKILQEQENLSQQVQNIADNYQELINKMQANETLSPETLQKMQKIKLINTGYKRTITVMGLVITVILLVSLYLYFNTETP